MALNNIKFKLVSKYDGYEYNGKSEVNKDLISFTDSDSYLIDRTAKRIKKNDMIFDFENGLCIMEELEFPITVNKYVDKDNFIDIEYKIDKNIFNINIEVGDLSE